MTTHAKGGRGKKGGYRETARQLGISEADVRRAIKVASLSPEAQQEAYILGLANNRTALLKSADAPTPEEQIQILREIADNKKLRQVVAVLKAQSFIEKWGRLSPEVKEMVYQKLLPEWAELARNDKREEKEGGGE